MKIAIILFALVSTCLAFDMFLDMKSYMDECAKEHKVDLSIFVPGMRPDPNLMKTRPYKCFGQCIAAKSGMVNAAGEFNIDKIKSTLHVSSSSVDEIVKCGKQNKQTDKCDRSYAIQQCIKRTVKGIFPE